MRALEEFAVVDFEMPDLYGRRISAAGICTYMDGRVVDSFYSLIDPQCEFAPSISEITGLTAESVIGAPTFGEAWESMRPLLENKIIVAHGAPNDLAAFSHCMKKYGIERPGTVRFACTFSLAQAVLGKKSRLGLEPLCEYFGIELKNHHNALDDAHACAELFLKLREECDEPEKYESTFNMLTYHAETARDRKRAENAARFTDALKALRSDEYAVFQKKQMPGVSAEALLGVPVKEIKKLSRQASRDIRKMSFLHSLPHKYYEENMLHAFLINRIKNVNSCIAELEVFLPYCDDMNVMTVLCPAGFRNHPTECLPWLLASLRSKKTGISLFACEYLRKMYLGKYYSPEQTEQVLRMRGKGEAAVSDAQARYLSELFLTHAEETVRVLDEAELDGETVKKTVKRIISKKTVDSQTKNELRRKYLTQ